ncbi:MAG: ABC transporter permease [Oscillospiraceae bacterium]|nr:ABC transporter permease [Oscillospiraceae bacterium]
MDRLNYIIKRFLQMIPVLIIGVILVFALVRFLPGDTATAILGDKARPEVLEAYREKMGLNEPIYVQFFVYCKSLLQLDLGDSTQYNMPVATLLASRLQVTILLTLMASLMTVIIGLPLGYIAGIKKERAADQGIRFFALLGLSLPTFWVGLMLMLIFGVHLRWFSISGWGTTWAEHFKGLFLPALTEAIFAASVIVRNVRNNVVDVREQDYVDYARSKGLGSFRVGAMHILRNAMIPTATLLSIRIITMLGGAVVVENIYSLQGMGALLVDAVEHRDYAVVQGAVLVFIIIVLLINLLTDILYSVLDPRITLE